MPDSAQHPCYHPGCNTLTLVRFCETHAKQVDGWGHRLSAAKRGYGAEWQRLRKQILKRDPVCCICKFRPANECDHIRPKANGGTDDESNLQGLCKGCHKEKTLSERTK